MIRLMRRGRCVARVLRVWGQGRGEMVVMQGVRVLLLLLLLLHQPSGGVHVRMRVGVGVGVGVHRSIAERNVVLCCVDRRHQRMPASPAPADVHD